MSLVNETINATINGTMALKDITVNQLAQIFNSTGGIPLKITQVTAQSPGQFYINVAIALFSSIFILIWMWGMIEGSVSAVFMKIAMNKLKKITGRNMLIVKHTRQGLFDGSMISQKTIQEVIKSMQKFEGKPFDLVLYTPGGEVFSSLYVSRLIKEYPAQVRAIVPVYSMSGGTLLALSCSEIYMNKTSCLGPVDPQLGTLFKYGSAKSWDKIVKFKGKKAEDSSISMAFMGEQYTKSIRNYIGTLLEGKMDQDKAIQFTDFITQGEVEHAFPLTYGELQKHGLPVKELDPEISKKLLKILSSNMYEGVYAI